MLLAVIILTIIVCLNAESYDIYCTGTCDGSDAVVQSTPGTVVMGGGVDVDEAMAWMITNANGGDFVVLRASGSDGYNVSILMFRFATYLMTKVQEYIYNMSLTIGQPLYSVRSVQFYNRSASYAVEVLAVISGADAILFAGRWHSDERV